MQVIPRFKSYKIIRQIPLLTDDTGNEMCLTLFEVRLAHDEYEVIERAYQYWSVVGRKQIRYTNGAVAHESCAYWNTKCRDKLYEGIVEGFKIEEVEAGEHRIFSQGLIIINVGIKTRFKISVLKK